MLDYFVIFNKGGAVLWSKQVWIYQLVCVLMSCELA